MNQATIDKLKKNPHYKMSDKQKAEARQEEIKRNGMVAIGAMEKHPVGMNKN